MKKIITGIICVTMVLSSPAFAEELIKRLVLAWDPDFTKVTPEEAAQIEAAENSGFVFDNEIDWNNLNKYSQ